MLTNLYLISFVILKLAVWSPFMVEGQSMEPTLHDHELFLIDRSADLPVERGEIVVFSFDQSFFYVKRVIGLPGDYLKLSGDKVYLRGRDGQYEALDEPYLLGNTGVGGGANSLGTDVATGDLDSATSVDFTSSDERFFEVPAGEYFVLGDNRTHSKDSRFFDYPYVKKADFYGKYIWP